MRPTSTLVLGIAIVASVCVQERASLAYTATRCFNQRLQGWADTDPYPIVAGMTKLVYAGPGDSVVWHDAFFDGANDLFSAPSNFIAGNVDCGQNPDVQVLWGYAFADPVATEGGLMQLGLTVYYRDVASPNQPCDFVDNPVLWQYTQLTDDAMLFSAASSIVAGIDGLECVPDRFFQIRIKATATVDFQDPPVPDEQNSCFNIWERNAGWCPGDGPICN